jgi:hypothetical protein
LGSSSEEDGDGGGGGIGCGEDEEGDNINNNNRTNNNTGEIRAAGDVSATDAANKPKQKRRTRHDPNNRDFFCGCGRAYLSYPALYTHIK